jgi:predicted regulator of Ras-like GTPase activity (Roadblock/LC7/MglB family)
MSDVEYDDAEDGEDEDNKVGAWASSVIGFGSALAITISWSQWHSIMWTIVDGIFNWFYVVYFAWTGPH